MEALMPLMGEMHEDVYLIGHSVGCQAALRLLDALPPGRRIGGAVLVAGWVSVPNWNGRSEGEIAVLNDWMNPPLVLSKSGQQKAKTLRRYFQTTTNSYQRKIGRFARKS